MRKHFLDSQVWWRWDHLVLNVARSFGEDPGFVRDVLAMIPTEGGPSRLKRGCYALVCRGQNADDSPRVVRVAEDQFDGSDATALLSITDDRLSAALYPLFEEAKKRGTSSSAPSVERNGRVRRAPSLRRPWFHGNPPPVRRMLAHA